MFVGFVGLDVFLRIPRKEKLTRLPENPAQWCDYFLFHFWSIQSIVLVTTHKNSLHMFCFAANLNHSSVTIVMVERMALSTTKPSWHLPTPTNNTGVATQQLFLRSRLFVRGWPSPNYVIPELLLFRSESALYGYKLRSVLQILASTRF